MHITFSNKFCRAPSSQKTVSNATQSTFRKKIKSSEHSSVIKLLGKKTAMFSNHREADGKTAKIFMLYQLVRLCMIVMLSPQDFISTRTEWKMRTVEHCKVIWFKWVIFHGLVLWFLTKRRKEEKTAAFGSAWTTAISRRWHKKSLNLSHT